MPDYTPVDYTPDFSLTTEQKEPAISIRPRYTPVETIPEFEDAVNQPVASAPVADANKPTILDRLFGANGAERYQLWPEKLVRSALEAPQKALRGELAPVPTEADPTGTAAEISAAQDMMNLVGVGAATPRPGGMIGMAGGKIVQPTVPTFYSAAEHAITNARQPQASADQWLGYLNNSPGVKAEELEWTGLSDLFAQRAAEGKPVTKQEILDHLGNNKVDVQTKVPAGGEDEHAYNEALGNLMQDLADRWASGDTGELILKPDPSTKGFHVYEGDNWIGFGRTKKEAENFKKEFEQAVKEGDEEYLLDVAEGAAEDHPDLQHYAQQIGTTNPAGQRYAEYQLPGGENYGELVLTLPSAGKVSKLEVKLSDDGKNWQVFQDGKRTGAIGNPPGRLLTAEEAKAIANQSANESYVGRKDKGYRSPHWDEPNILAHVRFNDRTINGKKTLFLEEVQSDWHQAGREKGYDKGDIPVPEGYEVHKATPQEIKQAKKEGHGNIEGQWVIYKGDELQGWGPNRNEIIRNNVEELSGTHGPVPDAPFKKTWPELVLKQMLRKAADEGYEQIAWTPGKVQNERYPGRPKEDEAGMAKFYDEILPNVANKLGKKFGAKTYNYDVGKAPGQEGKNLYKSKNYSVHVLPITTELRTTATSKGFPLFSTGLPFMFTPVDHNPFEEEHAAP